VNIAVAGTGGSTPTGNGPGLANTGNPAMPLVGGGALALLLAAGGVLLMVRRNQTTAADRRS
jgi:LPXTG-motif cell wall-anchored protein